MIQKLHDMKIFDCMKNTPLACSYNGNFSSTKLFYSQVCEANDKPAAGVFVYLRSPSVHCLLKPKHCLNGRTRAHE